MGRFSRLQLSAIFRLPPEIKTAFYISYALTSLIILLVLSVIFTIQPVVPLFYTLAAPEQQLVSKEWLLLFPIASSIISLGHTTIAQRVRNEDHVLGTFFSWSTVLVQVILALALLRIIWIVS